MEGGRQHKQSCLGGKCFQREIFITSCSVAKTNGGHFIHIHLATDTLHDKFNQVQETEYGLTERIKRTGKGKQATLFLVCWFESNPY